MAAIAGCLITGLIFIDAARRSLRMWAKVMAGVAGSLLIVTAGFLLIALNPWIADPQYRAYQRFYWDIREGMTRAEVLAAMERRYPAGGKRTRPQFWRDDADSMSFFMGVEEGQGPNCEGIFVRIRDGRVADKIYSPD